MGADETGLIIGDYIFLEVRVVWLDGVVSIRRIDMGVSSIIAHYEHDVWAGLGFASVTDRMF